MTATIPQQAPKNVPLRLTLMLFLEFAVWGAYLISQGRYLASVGLGSQIGWFFSVQGFVSIFMPAIIGMLADKYVPAQKMLAICHTVAGLAFLALTYYCETTSAVEFSTIFALYTVNVAFFMPTIALTNSISYNALDQVGADTVAVFPRIRIWGTIGFIVTMYAVDLCGLMQSSLQYAVSGVLSLVLAAYSLTLPACPLAPRDNSKLSVVKLLGLDSFKLFKSSKMAIFFIFSFLLGCALQVSNAFANPYLGAFNALPEYAQSFGVQHSNILISISQIAEALCILLIPFFLKRLGIKYVMAMAMLAWFLRFGFFGLGNPGDGVWLFVLSMIVYGVAFDFFNISGSLFVDQNTSADTRSSAQGLFILMTNGLGSALGSLAAQAVVNRCTTGLEGEALITGWTHAWFIFSAYALVITILFVIFFKNPNKQTK